jgi:hypothetical protein
MTIALFLSPALPYLRDCGPISFHPLTHGWVSGDDAFETLLSTISTEAALYCGSNAGI